MNSKLNQLKSLLNEIIDLYHISNLLGWDQQTYMPTGGVQDRSHHRSTLKRLYHAKFASDELGRLIEDLKSEVSSMDPDSDEARLVKVTEREHKRFTKIPAELATDLAQTIPLAYQVWKQARAENDFNLFRPYLEKIVDIRRSWAACFAPYEHIYDPLLDEFEPGMKTREVQEIFAQLRPKQVELIKAITSRPQIDDSALHQTFDPQKQWDFGVEVVTKFGYDWRRGRQDITTHPFTDEFGIGDVRITTRILPEYVGSAMFSTMHEAGHGMYDQGVDQRFERTTLCKIYSHAFHESQSRMWENLVGRSFPFWQHFYPRLQAYFPMQLGNVTLDSFYKGINKVEPSCIRVEADEATYNLHIMLRLELEIALISGELEVKDLPEAWNERIKDYLGIVPPDDSSGVLQDVHWSDGYFGYFSTYALGNLVAAQLWDKMSAEIPTLMDQIRQGKFDELLFWLREKVHRHGAKFEAQELVQKITGSKINPTPYIRYLHDKYSAIYGF